MRAKVSGTYYLIPLTTQTMIPSYRPHSSTDHNASTSLTTIWTHRRRFAPRSHFCFTDTAYGSPTPLSPANNVSALDDVSALWTILAHDDYLQMTLSSTDNLCPTNIARAHRSLLSFFLHMCICTTTPGNSISVHSAHMASGAVVPTTAVRVW